MCDLVPFRNLHRTSRCVSWTLHPPAAHHLLVCPSHPSHHLTPASKRSFSPALSLNCQTSHFQLLISFFWASHLSLPCTICSENSDPHCSKQTTQGWMWLWHTFLQSSFTGHWWYTEPQLWAKTPLCPALHKHRKKHQSWPPNYTPRGKHTQ